jgi:hypothetical protein
VKERGRYEANEGHVDRAGGLDGRRSAGGNENRSTIAEREVENDDSSAEKEKVNA